MFYRWKYYATKLLCRSNECDFDFLGATLTSNNIPDFDGYNTREARMAGQSTKPKTNNFYRPLIDKTPSDPSAVLTSMTDTEQICNAAGQGFTILTSDQQLYRVMVDITWSNSRWQLLIPRIGCVGKLMEVSGLNKLMASAFSGIEKMLISKNFQWMSELFVLLLMSFFVGLLMTVKRTKVQQNSTSF